MKIWGVTPSLATLTSGALLLALALPASAAPRSKTKFDGIRDCERLGSVQFKRHNPAFKRFVIDRATVEDDKYADKVAQTFVSTIYHGKATYDAATGPRPTRFICLHGGVGQNAVFVYTMPD
jgi:hypothetical protein